MPTPKSKTTDLPEEKWSVLQEKYFDNLMPAVGDDFVPPMRRALKEKNEKELRGLIKEMKKPYEFYGDKYFEFITYVSSSHEELDLQLLKYVQDNKLFENQESYQEAFITACKNANVKSIEIFLKNPQYELSNKELEKAIKMLPEEIKRLDGLYKKGGFNHHLLKWPLQRLMNNQGAITQLLKNEMNIRKDVKNAAVSIAQGKRSAAHAFYKLPDEVGGKIVGFLGKDDPKTEAKATKDIKSQIGKKKA